MSTQQIATNCKEQFTAAWQALRTPIETLKSLFQSKETTEINLSGNEGKEVMLEVRFENATINYLFDKENLCKGGILFFNDPTDIFQYIEYCYQTYDYDNESHGWRWNDCLIELYTERNDVHFKFSSVNPTGV